MNNSSVTNLFINISKNSSNFIPDSIKNINNNTTIIILQSAPAKIDPNWFYSSSAQCAAAIVGLMGAFLVTKLINQKAFVNQLNNEISDCKNKIALINQDITPKLEFIKDFDFENDCKTVKKFLDDGKPYINPDNPLSLDKIYEIAKEYEELKNIPIEVFKHEYDDKYLVEVRKTAEELVDQCFKNSSAIKHIDIDNPPDAQSLYGTVTKEEKKYKFMNSSIFGEKYKKYIKTKKKERGTVSYFASLPNYQEMFKMPDTSGIVSMGFIENQRIKLKRYSNYKDEVATKNAEMFYYNELIKEKEKLLKFNKEIPNLKSNIILLFIFSLVGVFLPLSMLLLDDKTMLEYRFHTLLLIFIGWLLIVNNLRSEIWGLIGNNSKKI